MNTLTKDLIFPQLGMEYNALEPYIDSMTMEIHYTKHHRAYYDNLMNAVKATEMENMSFIELLNHISKYPTVVRNNGGGHFNHSMFWKLLSGKGGGEPQGELREAILKKFNSFDEFKSTFSDAAKNRFGSGWAWLSVNHDGSLLVASTPNQDNPLMDLAECHGLPILGLDVWEHAYYLKYQNRRPDYIAAFWNIINWKVVEENYRNALSTIR
ncbi:MAG: Superoxide dismutase [Bacteroidetes bacterium 38_7]|jgi:Fe-Mn family superoxide dismutase|nr:MAG: Superoxide dismutase [Bacteroidetes bacterium 38_7]HAL65251.1 superoxide dismutase [Bacteroidales bacterium]HQQ01711.1 superoxide dismutase [Bacteroidales bacterium]